MMSNPNMSYKVISPPPFPFRIRGEEAAAVAFGEFPHAHYSGFCSIWQGTLNKEAPEREAFLFGGKGNPQWAAHVLQSIATGTGSHFPWP